MSSNLTSEQLTETNEMHEEILNNIKQLQQVETDAHNELQLLASQKGGGDNSERQQELFKSINDTTEARENLFKILNESYKRMQNDVGNTRQDLVDQLTLAGLVEKQLENAKQQIGDIKAVQDNKQKMVEINTYYSKKTRAYTDLMKMIIMVCVPILILAILAKKGFLSSNIASGAGIVIMVVGGYYVGSYALDLSRRNNMDFDEYDWSWDPSQINQQSVLQYDEEQINKLLGKSSAMTELTGVINGDCVGQACCPPTDKYTDAVNRCVPFCQEGEQYDVKTDKCIPYNLDDWPSTARENVFDQAVDKIAGESGVSGYKDGDAGKMGDELIKEGKDYLASKGITGKTDDATDGTSDSEGFSNNYITREYVSPWGDKRGIIHAYSNDSNHFSPV